MGGLLARRCVICDDPLPAGARPQARTCSDRCRQALSRQRHGAPALVDEPADMESHNAPPPAARWQEQDPDDWRQRRLGHWVNPDDPEGLW